MAYCNSKRISNSLYKLHANSNYQRFIWQWPPQLTRRLSLYAHSCNINPMPIPIPIPSHRFPALPVNDKLLDQLIMDQARIRMRHIDTINPPKGDQMPTNGIGITLEEVKKAVRGAHMEAARDKLRATPRSCVSYDELVAVCEEIAGSEKSARELARAMDESGAVVVLGGVVILRPEMVTKAIERILMMEATVLESDDDQSTKRKELEEMEEEKAVIDGKAEKLVNAELWCGLGLLAVQTLGFMRLTFWELSWDVMEPICFFVTSFYFMAGYAFFLRTSRDPSFEAFFESRFRARQKKLITKRSFNVNKYNKLKLQLRVGYQQQQQQHGGVFNDTSYD